MTTNLTLARLKPTPAAPIAHRPSQISAEATRFGRRLCRAAGLLGLVIVGGCSSSLGSNPDGATSTCDDVSRAYDDAIVKAQECTVGAANQCSVQVRASFWCNCMTWVNSDTTTLASLANQYQALQCRSVCNGVCAQPRSLDCLADATSSTGGRCTPPALLNLTAADDGRSFSVQVGYEIDILLQSIGGTMYQMNATLSSDAATVLEVTIPAGPITPAGPPYLYRIKALAPGQVVVQIPYTSLAADASQLMTYTVTLNIS
jgi:hypothetical protein